MGQVQRRQGSLGGLLRLWDLVPQLNMQCQDSQLLRDDQSQTVNNSC